MKEKKRKLDSIKQESESPRKRKKKVKNGKIPSFPLYMSKGESGKCSKQGKGERERAKIQEKTQTNMKS